MFGRGRSFDRIDLAVKEGRTLKDAEQELARLLGPGFQVDPPSGRGQQFEAMLAAYSMMVGISSLFALFIGMFIIYNSFAIAVTQRRSEIGILRALGATRGQIARILLAEYSLLGFLGGLTGMLLSIAGGWAVVRYVFKTPFAPSFAPIAGIAAAVVGLTLLIGLLAGRDVFRETPIAALRDA